MTGLGIAVAIPAVVFYNLAIRINRRVLFQANDRAHDLLAQTVTKVEDDKSTVVKEPAAVQAAQTKASKPNTSYANASAS